MTKNGIKKVDDEKDNKKNTLFSNYRDLMVRHPFLMNGLQAGIINGCSVAASQIISYFNSKDSTQFTFNHTEILVMTIIGIIYVTPVILLFYSYLNKFPYGGNIGKLIVDQFLFSPIFTFGIIALRLFMLGNRNPKEIFNIALSIAPTAIKSSWLFWIPQRYYSLTYVAPVYQLLFGNICSFAWNIILALILK